MRSPLDLRLVDEDDTPDAPPSGEPPRVFGRAVQTPPGWPWEQTRGALLEARHGAPLPMDQMQLRLKRLTPWRPSQPARFAASYIRTAELQERFETKIDVDGQAISMVFEPPEALARRARRSLIAGVAAAGVAALLFVSVTAALLARAEGEEQLATLERDASVKLQRAETAQTLQRQSAALAAARPGDPISAATSDLAWAMAARAPDARIESWRWDHGASRVAARGDDPPFIDPRRTVTREGAAGHGVWSWRIEPEAVAR